MNRRWWRAWRNTLDQVAPVMERIRCGVASHTIASNCAQDAAEHEAVVSKINPRPASVPPGVRPQGVDQQALTSFVRFDNVHKTFDGKTTAVRGLNLHIREGEFITLLGPSGSGKTTTLLMLAGFETPTVGEILVNERPITRVPPYKRNFGMVFQNYALFPHMTVIENVAFPLAMRRVRGLQARDRARRALRMVQLKGLEERGITQLSGGQQQRVALARALVFEPVLLLMDEPLGALDKKLREQMQVELTHLHKRLGITTIYVTHDQSEALTMSDRIAVFKDGEVQQIDTSEVIYNQPTNSFVAHFIGECNSLDGIIERFDREHCIVRLDNEESVVATPLNAQKPGQQTTLSVRPENIKLGGPNELHCTNEFKAKVSELTYLGDHLRCRINVVGTDDFVLKLHKESGFPDIQVGDVIHVGWEPHHCLALDRALTPSE